VEEREELVEAMVNSTGRLRRLLSDLLTASRLEASALEMREETVEIEDVLDRAVAVVRRSHPTAELVVDVAAGLAVTGDRDRLAQVLENLLVNAVRHGEPPVHVTARATESGTVEIRVGDAGPGVAAAVRPRLFNRFATGATSGGTGLGLFIVRELVRAQGGEVTYESGSAGSPAGEFVIRLDHPVAHPMGVVR
jgi:signal transduction histidine kinase